MVLSSEHTFAYLWSFYVILCLLSLPNIQLLGVKHSWFLLVDTLSWRDFRHPHITSTAKSIGQESFFFHFFIFQSLMGSTSSSSWTKEPFENIYTYYTYMYILCTTFEVLSKAGWGQKILCWPWHFLKKLRLSWQFSLARFTILNPFMFTLDFHNNASIKCHEVLPQLLSFRRITHSM